MDIYIKGEINYDAFVRFHKKIAISLEIGDRKEIEVLLISDGGCAEAALAFYDFIRYINEKTFMRINITALGSVQSAAVLVLASGKTRRMGRNCWCMVHEDSVSELSGDVHTVERMAEQLRRAEKQWSTLLAERSKASAAYWERLHNEETYLSAEECLELGLIEEIV